MPAIACFLQCTMQSMSQASLFCTPFKQCQTNQSKVAMSTKSGQGDCKVTGQLSCANQLQASCCLYTVNICRVDYCNSYEACLRLVMASNSSFVALPVLSEVCCCQILLLLQVDSLNLPQPLVKSTLPCFLQSHLHSSIHSCIYFEGCVLHHHVSTFFLQE